MEEKASRNEGEEILLEGSEAITLGPSSENGVKKDAQQNAQQGRQQKGKGSPAPGTGLFFDGEQRGGAGKMYQRKEDDAAGGHPGPAILD